MSLVRRRYCGHNFSSEFTWVIPAEPHTAPSPVKPRSFAPQGTASIFSSMALASGFFFLPPAVAGMAGIMHKASTTNDKADNLNFIIPPFLYLRPPLEVGLKKPIFDRGGWGFSCLPPH